MTTSAKGSEAKKQSKKNAPAEKKYFFYHTAPGSDKKLYHVDTCCTVSTDVKDAKIYSLSGDRIEEQLATIRANFEFTFEYPEYAAYDIWRGAKVGDIKTQYGVTP